MHGSLQHLAPVINQTQRGRTLRLAFVSAVVSLVVSFAAAAAPIPLYNIYRAEDGFTNVGISIAVVAYAIGTIAALLGLGRLSNHLGRRLTAIISLSLVLLGCVLLLNVHGIATLLVGRLLVGLGTGSASSSLTSYIVDAAPSRPEWLAPVASSQGPMLGLTVGVIASGALVQFGPWPRDLIYLVCIGFLLLSAALIAISPETATPTPGAWRSLLPRVSVPARVRHLLPVAAAVFLATWATGGFLSSIRARASRRSTPHPQPAHTRTGVRRLYDPQRSRRSHGRPVHIRASPTRRYDPFSGRNDRPLHGGRRQHTGFVHYRNHRRRSWPGNRH
ncbi:MFS family permease [Bradyrhizobium ottawaense]